MLQLLRFIRVALATTLKVPKRVPGGHATATGSSFSQDRHTRFQLQGSKHMPPGLHQPPLPAKLRPHTSPTPATQASYIHSTAAARWWRGVCAKRTDRRGL